MLRDVVRETKDYFNLDALRGFLLLSPRFHANVAARYQGLSPKEKSAAVHKELLDVLSSLEARYSSGAEGEFEGEKVTVGKRMSVSGMRKQLMTLHNLMLRNEGKSAYEMAAGIATGCVCSSANVLVSACKCKMLTVPPLNIFRSRWRVEHDDYDSNSHVAEHYTSCTMHVLFANSSWVWISSSRQQRSTTPCPSVPLTLSAFSAS